MHKIIGFLGDIERRVAYFLLVLLTTLLFVQILNRYLFMTSIAWMEETCRLSFVWLIYFSVAIAAKENQCRQYCLIWTGGQPGKKQNRRDQLG